MKALLAFLILASCMALAQDGATDHPLQKGLEATTTELLQGYLGTLASDEYEGRCAGFPGNDKAALYLAARMKEAGLKPVGIPDVSGEPTYFQPFLFDDGRRLTRNCVGLLEGGDPALKDQIVVIGAHFDHVGRRGQHTAGQLGRLAKDDEIWNGADDNGSGTTTLLGILKGFAASGRRPRRSILFMWFSAEEWGLFGSKWYADHPLFPLEKTVAMINLDMTGRTDDDNIANGYGSGTFDGDVAKPIAERAMKRAGFTLTFDPNYGEGSDHCSFADKKVPVFGIGEKGPCPDYHRVSDHADKINYGYMVKIAKVAAMTLYDIADLEKSPKWNPAFSRPAPKEGKTPRMGIYFASVDASELAALGLKDRGALRANGTVKGGAGEKAGILKDDIVISFMGLSFDPDTPRETMRELIDTKVERGKDYAMEYLRDGRKHETKISWPPLPPEEPAAK